MAFPTASNISGANPGPNSAVLPDTVQMPTGNLWKVGDFTITLTPAAVAAASAPLQNFANTGIGLLVGDQVTVTTQNPLAGVGIAGAAVTAADQLTIQYVNPTAGSLTPTAGNYIVSVFRVQPNWTKPVGLPQIDF